MGEINRATKSILSKKAMEYIVDQRFCIRKDIVEYDNHNIRKEWFDILNIIDTMGPDLDRFLQIKSPGAGRRTRKNFSKIKQLIVSIYPAIQCQIQDNASEYE